ncbi:HEXXH motif domain-containing protein [Streptomyces sp. NPDC016845]|uniref:HEXXH motif domain-containing protein n=1 Tax=Streptomyces sp. NPDC016845 TaxID=3364972 RepID=UPI00378907CA
MPAEPAAPATALRRHGFSEADFDALAGGGGSTRVLHGLWQAERSHRLLMIDLFLDLLRESPWLVGPLEATDEPWRLLVEADRRAHDTVEELLMAPETGLWLGGALRALRSTAPPASEPLWVEAGHFHALAAAAALRTGAAFTLGVPSRYGTVSLPGVGRAVVPGAAPWGRARVTAGADEVTVEIEGRTVRVTAPYTAPGPGWEPARTITLVSPGAPRSVLLDDLGPHRIVPTAEGRPPGRLPADEAERWTELLHEAAPLLAAADAQSATDVGVLLRSLEPVERKGVERLPSATSGDGAGRLASARPPDAEQLAAVLAHEIQHTKLSMLMHLYQLYEPDDDTLFYTPWRDEPRPLRGLLQGVYAFTAVTRFWRGRALSPVDDHATAGFEYALWRRQLLRVLRDFETHKGLTELGRRLVRRLGESVAQGEHPARFGPVDAMARDAADHHTMSWRLHHLEPDPATVTALAGAWPAPLTPMPAAAARLCPDTGVPRLDVMAALYRSRLAEPEGPASGLPRGTRPAHTLHVRGDAAGAVGAAVAALVKGGAERSSWADLLLALRAQGPGAPGRVARKQPELARAVDRALSRRDGAGPGPVALVTWLDGLAPAPREPVGD